MLLHLIEAECGLCGRERGQAGARVGTDIPELKEIYGEEEG